MQMRIILLVLLVAAFVPAAFAQAECAPDCKPPFGGVCINGTCVALGPGPVRTCDINQSECVDSQSYHICESYVSWGPTINCSSGQACFDGNCVKVAQQQTVFDSIINFFKSLFGMK